MLWCVVCVYVCACVCALASAHLGSSVLQSRTRWVVQLEQQLADAQSTTATLQKQVEELSKKVPASFRVRGRCHRSHAVRARVCGEQLGECEGAKATLERNISTLFATAKLEIQRKNDEIVRLRRLSVCVLRAWCRALAPRS
jgi:hypothetical protein